MKIRLSTLRRLIKEEVAVYSHPRSGAIDGATIENAFYALHDRQDGIVTLDDVARLLRVPSETILNMLPDFLEYRPETDEIFM